MKKLILILVAAVGVSATSCSSFGGGSTTAQDSLAYALGVSIGNNLWSNVDSTMSADLVCQGIKDVFAKKDSMMKVDEAQQFIQTYMTVTKPKLDSARNDKLSKEYLAKMEKEAGVVKSSTGLLYKIENAGSELKPAAGDTMIIDFTLYDITGKKIQSSADFGRPLDMVNTDDGAIAGFLEGVRMLGTGGKATLYVPSELGYGEGGPSPMMALTFEVELKDIKKPVAQPEEAKK